MTSRREAFLVLGITPDATQTEVRAAFRRKAIEHHPDTASNEDDGSTVRELIDAYHLLTSPPVTSVETGARDQQIRVDPSTTKQGRGSAERSCPECRTTGSRIYIVNCPACFGTSLLMTLDIRQVKVFRCPRCQGRGRIPIKARCRACDGTGLDAP